MVIIATKEILILKSTATNIVLKTTDLSIGYTSKKSINIVQNKLNLELKKGALTCLLGNNGVGKSTLLKTLANMNPLLNGEILIDSENINTFSPAQLAKKVSIVLTEALPPSNLTVFELVALGRQPYTNWLGNLSDKDTLMVSQSLEQTEITDIAQSKMHELSDGQKQRVMIARALAQNTDIIILDEPTAHLDMHHKIAVLKLLKNLCKTLNKSILIATHEVSFAIQLADILWLMYPDRCIMGTPDVLISNKTLQELFKSDLINFDANTKHFNINNT